MSAVEKWADDKPKEFALLAQKIALSAEPICKMAGYFYDTGPYAKILTFPSLEEWHGFYKQHREISSFLLEMLATFFPSKATTFSQIGKTLKQTPKANDDKSDEIKMLINEHGDDIYKMILNESMSEYSADDFTLEEQEKNVAIFTDPKMNFYINVYMLCDAFYGEEPGQLLRKARMGDFDSLEKLLRLDEKLISEPRIARQVFKLQAEGKQARYLKLIECLGKKPKLKFTLQKIKYVKAGQISAFADHFDVKLTSPDIRALFNALSIDRGLGMEDSDLYDIEDETFRKAVQRERRYWKGKIDRDKI